MYPANDMTVNYRVPAVRAILFDKDGTLFDFRRTWVPVFHEATLRLAGGDESRAADLLRAAGYNPETDSFTPDGPIAAGTVEDVARAWSDMLPHRDRSALAAEMDRYSLDFAPNHSVPVCDLPDLMGTLQKAGFLLGMATSDSAAGARAALARFGLSGFFSWVSGYDSGHGHKPDPALIHAFARSVGVRVEEVAMVGDTFHDLRMGRNAGAALTIGVLTGAVPEEILAPEADVILRSIADLPVLLHLCPDPGLESLR